MTEEKFNTILRQKDSQSPSQISEATLLSYQTITTALRKIQICDSDYTFGYLYSKNPKKIYIHLLLMLWEMTNH